jgi:DNA-binding response OmpR family regulator
MHMLVADDDPIYRKVFANFARKMGHDPLVASDGEEALELYLRNRPRLVLSDWIMPRLSGVELCRKIRGIGSEERPYIILVTSLSANESVLEGFHAGADDYVAKPFDQSVFESRVNAGISVVQSAFAVEERLHRELIAKCQNALGHDHPELGASVAALTRLYVEQRTFAKARAFLRRQIDIASRAGDTSAVERLRLAIEDIHKMESNRATAAPAGLPT